MCDVKKENGLLSVEEAAEYLGVTKWQIYRLIREKRVPVKMVDVVVKMIRKSPHFSPDDLQKYKQSRWLNKDSEKGDH